MPCSKFKTQFDPPEVLAVETGRGMTNVYQFVINEETGREELKKTGETDTYAVIQAHAEQTKIENILARATLDPSILNQRAGEYIDATEMPTSLMDAQIKIMGVKNEFEQLPNEIRKQFNYSLGEYIAQYGTEGWANALGLTQEETHELKEVEKQVQEIAQEGEKTND